MRTVDYMGSRPIASTLMFADALLDSRDSLGDEFNMEEVEDTKQSNGQTGSTGGSCTAGGRGSKV